MSLDKQEMLLEHLDSSPVLVRFVLIQVLLFFCGVLSIIVCPLSFLPLYCPSFDLRFLTIGLSAKPNLNVTFNGCVYYLTLYAFNLSLRKLFLQNTYFYCDMGFN